jgi:glucose/arabinose dehydrogenase
MPPAPTPPIDPMNPPASADGKPCDTPAAMTAPALKRTMFARIPGGNAGQVAAPNGEKGIVYIVAHGSGAVYAVQNGMLVNEPFAKVSVNNADREQGLLSIAFHPDFAKNQLFYLSYTATNKAMTVDEFKRLTPTTSMLSKNIYRKTRNVGNNYHNGGSIYFNPKDGAGKPWLYHSVGNWSGDDAPSPNADLGRVLRYDVTNGEGVPGTAGGVGGRTFAYGLRNPYRMSIDRLTGDMYIGEIANGKGGAIFFNPYPNEGTNFGYGGDGDREINGGNRNLTGVDRTSDAIIGGVVYRGNKIPGLCGRYFYGSYGGGLIKSLVVQDGRAVGQQTHNNLSVGGLSSFGEDGEGEIYMSSHDSNQVFKLEAM